MKTRERFVKTLTGEPVDRVPFMKIFGQTNEIHPHWEDEYPGIGECLDELIGFEGAARGWDRTEVNMGPSNMGEPDVLQETDEIIVRRRGDGTVEQVHKGGDYNRHTIEWSIKTMRDWEVYKEKHLDPNDPSRFPDGWNAKVKEYKDRDYP